MFGRLLGTVSRGAPADPVGIGRICLSRLGRI